MDLNQLMQMMGGGQGLRTGGAAIAPEMGAQGLQMGSPPAVPGMGAQGLQGDLQGMLHSPEALDKLAMAPLDPSKILALIQSQQQQQQPPHAQAVAPAQGRNVQPMQMQTAQGFDGRPSLAQLLGG